MIVLYTLSAIAAFAAFLKVLNVISYDMLKDRILNRRKWDLNICCGKTDGGGVNADIVKHGEVPKFVKIDDVYHLPFPDKAFERVLCSHTIEHVEDPEAFFEELQRVGEEVTLVLPPLWDISAALNVLEHKHVFLTFKKEHTTLPPYVSLPLARPIQETFGQRMHA